MQELHYRLLSELGRCIDFILAVIFKDWILMKAICFRTRSDRLWGTRKLLYNG